MKDPKSEIINRAIIFYVVMAICGIVVIWSIISIQVYQKDELLEKANKRELKVREEVAHRGNVYSKNGTLLATSVPRFNIYFDPVSVKESLFESEISQLSDSLSRLFKDKSKSKYESYLRQARNSGLVLQPL